MIFRTNGVVDTPQDHKTLPCFFLTAGEINRQIGNSGIAQWYIGFEEKSDPGHCYTKYQTHDYDRSGNLFFHYVQTFKRYSFIILYDHLIEIMNKIIVF